MRKNILPFISLCCVVLFLTFGCDSMKSNTDAKTALLYLDLSRDHLDKGNKQDALAALLKAEKLDEKNKEILNQLGLTYFSFKKYALAEKYFSRALSEDSSYTESRNNLARVQIELGKTQSARDELHIVLEDLTFKNTANAFLNMGLSYFRDKNYKTAIHYLEKSLKQNPSSCFTMTTYGRCFYELNNFTKAINLFDVAMPLCQKLNSDEAHYFGALSYFKSGQRSKGIALMNETILLYHQGEYEKKSRDMLELMKLNKL